MNGERRRGPHLQLNRQSRKRKAMTMRRILAISLTLLPVAFAFLCSQPRAFGDDAKEEKVITTKSGLKYVELEGNGAEAKTGDRCRFTTPDGSRTAPSSTAAGTGSSRFSLTWAGGSSKVGTRALRHESRRQTEAYYSIRASLRRGWSPTRHSGESRADVRCRTARRFAERLLISPVRNRRVRASRTLPNPRRRCSNSEKHVATTSIFSAGNITQDLRICFRGRWRPWSVCVSVCNAIR